MAQYSLAAGQWNAATIGAQIGRNYHVGISDGARWYGYIFQNTGKESTGFTESSDTTSKDSLIQYSSGQLIDRDIAYFPRATYGDFSGGGYQEVWLDPALGKYFDSDLDPRIPGYLQLRAQWTRVSKTGLTVGANFQTVAWNGDFWFTFGEANGNVYSANGGTTTVPVAASILALDTDGQYLYAGTGAQLYRSANGSAWTAVTSSITGTATKWWVFNLGTAGYFAYYTSGTNLLYKIDLTAGFPIAAGAQPQVPLGANGVTVVDIAEYQNGLAILTNDPQPMGFDVWFHDGTNFTRIVRVEGYTAQGICGCLGNLYVGAAAAKLVNSPVLALVSGGQFQEVAKPGSPFPTNSQNCLGPRASGRYVYWPLIQPSLNGISTAHGVVVQYDTMTGAIMHLPNQDATDFNNVGASTLRSIAIFGDSVACCYVNGTTGVLQYQTPVFGSIKYQPSGWLASSHMDFGTPGIIKRFRRVEVHHAPLNTGEQILVEAFVDTDPLAFTTALAPVPAGATATNATVGTSLTALTMGADTVGKTMYFALKLTSATQNTTPRVSYASIEIGGTWVWEFDFDCSSKRRLLDGGAEDSQAVKGKDLHFLLRNAYENGTNLTLYLANGVSYTVAVESLKGKSVGYLDHAGTSVKADEEWLTHCVLRQVA